MNRLNKLFTIYSLIAFVIIIERLLHSPILQPYDFIRLHEFNQTVIFLTIIMSLSFFYLQVITKNFETLKYRKDQLFILMLIVGAYLYGAGEGWHEVASFTLNQYCDSKNLIGNLCNGLFINDYYTGNIIFFSGGVLINIALLSLALMHPMKRFNDRETIILFVNSIVFAFTWFAYSAFDKVLVGLFFSALLMIIAGIYFSKIKKDWREYPYITYSIIAYTLATIGAILVRFH